MELSILNRSCWSVQEIVNAEMELQSSALSMEFQSERCIASPIGWQSISSDCLDFFGSFFHQGKNEQETKIISVRPNYAP